MRIYLDTNAFFYFFFENRDYSGGIRKIFNKIKTGEYKAMTSCFTLEELAYIVLLELLESRYKKHPNDILRADRGAIAEVSKEIADVFASIYSFDNINITGSDKRQVWFIPNVMGENLLLPRDSIHLKTMREHNIEYILSTDSDFDNIKGIKRINPESI